MRRRRKICIERDGCNRMTELNRSQSILAFGSLCVSFLRSRGGWIALAFIVSVIAKYLQSDRLDGLDGMLVVGVIGAWPFLEWFFHRFLMHEWTFLPLHLTHHRHHLAPTTDNGLPDSWIVLLYFVGVSVCFFLDLSRLQAINVSVLGMLMLYEFVHFSCHCNYKPMTWWGWAIRVNHLQHHRLDERSRYAMLFPIVKQ